MTGLINTLSELSAESDEITATLGSLRSQSALVKDSYAEILSMTSKLRTMMLNLSTLSENRIENKI
jgi:hypothetical protein